MKKTSIAGSSGLREAEERDIPHLAAHHRKMFEEIGEKSGRPIDRSTGIEIEQAYVRKLKEELPAGSCKSWLIEKDGQILASGGVTIVSFTPTPIDLSPKVGYLHSIYTEIGMRGNNLAHRIVEAALGHCRQIGIKRVILTASDAGRPVYEKIGFTPFSQMMRITID